MAWEGNTLPHALHTVPVKDQTVSISGFACHALSIQPLKSAIDQKQPERMSESAQVALTKHHRLAFIFSQFWRLSSEIMVLVWTDSGEASLNPLQMVASAIPIRLGHHP